MWLCAQGSSLLPGELESEIAALLPRFVPKHKNDIENKFLADLRAFLLKQVPASSGHERVRTRHMA